MRKCITWLVAISAPLALALPVLLASGCTGEAYSSQIAFVSDRNGNQEIYVMDTDGSNQIRLTNSPKADDDPAWSPDGKKIAFASSRDKNRGSEIYVMDADGSNQTRLTNVPGSDKDPAWSPDGKKIAFASTRDEGYLSEIYVMNADGGNQRRLSHNPGIDRYPVWSPDSKKIAYESARKSNTTGWEVYAVDVETGEEINLTSNPANDFGPRWSPDGKKIAFGSERDGHGEIYVMNADGTEQTRLTNYEGPPQQPGSMVTPGCWQPRWSPDGERIAFMFFEPTSGFDVYVINSDGTNQTALTDFSPHCMIELSGWSPDCQKLIFCGFISKEQMWSGSCDIWVMDSDGSNLVNVSHNPAVDDAPECSPG